MYVQSITEARSRKQSCRLKAISATYFCVCARVDACYRVCARVDACYRVCVCVWIIGRLGVGISM
jgi:hypothetical protein